MRFQKHSGGWTMIELMVVAGIMAILASLLTPRFISFVAKARQVEAKNNLSVIYTLQKAYFEDNQRFFDGDLGGESAKIDSNDVSACNVTNALGFKMTSCDKVRYSYDTEALNNGQEFLAEAIAEYKAATSGGGCSSAEGAQQGIIAGCEEEDIWSMDDKKSLVHVADAIAACVNP